MLGPQTLVLLRIDEPLDLLRNPAAVVDLEVLQQALDQPQLVVRIDDLEILRQFCFLPVPPQQAVRKAVERADPEMTDGHSEECLDAASHLRSRFVRKRDRKQPLRRDALDVDEPGSAMHEHAGLAAAGAGNDEGRLGRRGDRLALSLVQGFEDRGDVHEAQKCSRIAPATGRRDSVECPEHADGVAGTVVLDTDVVGGVLVVSEVEHETETGCHSIAQ